jgi:hypothetical protein
MAPSKGLTWVGGCEFTTMSHKCTHPGRKKSMRIEPVVVVLDKDTISGRYGGVPDLTRTYCTVLHLKNGTRVLVNAARTPQKSWVLPSNIQAEDIQVAVGWSVPLPNSSPIPEGFTPASNHDMQTQTEPEGSFHHDDSHTTHEPDPDIDADADADADDDEYQSSVSYSTRTGSTTPSMGTRSGEHTPDTFTTCFSGSDNASVISSDDDGHDGGDGVEKPRPVPLAPTSEASDAEKSQAAEEGLQE